MLNRITIIGRLTKDPELRYTQNNKAVASFTIAVERDFADADGDRKADFINCVAWSGTAEFVSKYFHKGSMAVVSGRLQTRTYQAKDGGNRVAVEVVADAVYFGEPKKTGDRGVFVEVKDDEPLPF